MKVISNCEAFVNVGTGLGTTTVGVGIGVGAMVVGVAGGLVAVSGIGLGVRLGIGVGVFHTVVTEGVGVIARGAPGGVAVGSRSGAIRLINVAHKQQLVKLSTKGTDAISVFPNQD